jgi:hypothetical protein
MQIGLITLDGRIVGNVTWSDDADDAFWGGAPEGAVAGAPLDAGGERHHRGADGEPRHRHRDGGGRERDDRDYPDLKLSPPGPLAGDHVSGEFAAARDRARAELAAKPWLNEKAMHIFAGENRDPTASTALWESAINRMAVRGTSLEKELRRHASSGKDEGGYYAGYASHVDPHTRQVLEASRDRALSYSNVSNYATDNSSGALAARERASGSFLHRSTYNHEHFFAPGHAEPALRDQWRRMMYGSEVAKEAEKTAKAMDKPFNPETDPM